MATSRCSAAGATRGAQLQAAEDVCGTAPNEQLPVTVRSHESESLPLCAIFHESQQITALRTMTSPLAVHVFESQIPFPE